MADRATTARNIGNIALWVLQVLLAAYIVYSGVQLFGDGFVKKFDEIGFGQWLRYLTGVLEIAGGLGLLIPRLCGLAALGVAGVMAGAVATELFLVANGGPGLPLILMLLAVVVAVFRWNTVKALLTGTTGK